MLGQAPMCTVELRTSRDGKFSLLDSYRITIIAKTLGAQRTRSLMFSYILFRGGLITFDCGSKLFALSSSDALDLLSPSMMLQPAKVQDRSLAYPLKPVLIRKAPLPKLQLRLSKDTGKLAGRGI